MRLTQFFKPCLWLLSGIMLPTVVHASNLLNVDFSKEGLTERIVVMIVMLAVLSLAPAIIMTVTSFARFVIVFSMARGAMGLQQSPSNMVLISLALFMTGFVMTPQIQQSYSEGLQPYIEKKITEDQFLQRSIRPFHAFMLHHARSKDLKLFADFQNTTYDNPEKMPLHIVMPAFLISELRRAFEIGFLLYIPFLMIDLIVASILMSLGMMMLPPVMISFPFKIIFFVLIDGWYLLVGTLLRGYGL